MFPEVTKFTRVLALWKDFSIPSLESTRLENNYCHGSSFPDNQCNNTQEETIILLVHASAALELEF